MYIFNQFLPCLYIFASWVWYLDSQDFYAVKFIKYPLLVSTFANLIIKVFSTPISITAQLYSLLILLLFHIKILSMPGIHFSDNSTDSFFDPLN